MRMFGAFFRVFGVVASAIGSAAASDATTCDSRGESGCIGDSSMFFQVNMQLEQADVPVATQVSSTGDISPQHHGLSAPVHTEHANDVPVATQVSSTGDISLQQHDISAPVHEDDVDDASMFLQLNMHMEHADDVPAATQVSSTGDISLQHHDFSAPVHQNAAATAANDARGTQVSGASHENGPDNDHQEMHLETSKSADKNSRSLALFMRSPPSYVFVAMISCAALFGVLLLTKWLVGPLVKKESLNSSGVMDREKLADSKMNTKTAKDCFGTPATHEPEAEPADTE